MNKREIDALLRKVARGDNNAFAKLYEHTRKGVYAFIYSYLSNPTDCEDLMQIVYLKIKTGISGYKAGTNGIAWILQIAKNASLNFIRSKREVQSLDQITELKGNAFEDQTIKKSALLTAIKKELNEEEQRILILHAVWNYKHKEIAKMLDLPIGTITSKYKRAREKLKKTLKGAL